MDELLQGRGCEGVGGAERQESRRGGAEARGGASGRGTVDQVACPPLAPPLHTTGT